MKATVLRVSSQLRTLYRTPLIFGFIDGVLLDSTSCVRTDHGSKISRGHLVSNMASYLSLDLSTQRLKAGVVNDDLELVKESEVHFDSHLPEYRTQGGVVKKAGGEVTSPVLMWVKALDLVLTQLQLDGVDFSAIKSVSGTAQQHGSVYWQKGAENILKKLDSNSFLHEQLASSFAVLNSPVWMDSSTSAYCKKLEDAVGGPEKLTKRTGSRAYERFTASQISKIALERQAAYSCCERISLVSSFLCSIFLGNYAPIDFSDGSGMNLLDIHSYKWDPDLLEATGAPDLEKKLGDPAPPCSNLGNISPYFVDRFGFKSDCKIVVFTGDNPASFAGMCLNDGDVIVSLGTSDTVIFPLPEPRVFPAGHVLCSPITPHEYIALLCFKNGSLTRERIRGNISWEDFGLRLDATPRGNFGNLGLYFDDQEILPFAAPGDYRWNAQGIKLSKFPSEDIEARAVIEGQFLARRAYGEDVGLDLKGGRVIATGGASSNKNVLQVLADVFNKPVYVQESGNSAVLGSAFIAKLGINPQLTFKDIVARLPPPSLACEPNKDAPQVYDNMVRRYRFLAEDLVNSNKL